MSKPQILPQRWPGLACVLPYLVCAVLVTCSALSPAGSTAPLQGRNTQGARHTAPVHLDAMQPAGGPRGAKPHHRQHRAVYAGAALVFLSQGFCARFFADRALGWHAAFCLYQRMQAQSLHTAQQLVAPYLLASPLLVTLTTRTPRPRCSEVATRLFVRSRGTRRVDGAASAGSR